MAGNFIDISESGLGEAIQALERPKLGIDAKYLKGVQRRYAVKHFVPEMKQNSPSERLGEMVSVTQATKYAGPRGVRVGVVKNDTDLFPTFSAQALATVIEYGTQERFRQTGPFSADSTGEMTADPWLRKAFDNNALDFIEGVMKAIERKVEIEVGNG